MTGRRSVASVGHTIEAADRQPTSAETIEIAVWVSVLQPIHRLSLFHGLDGHHE